MKIKLMLIESCFLFYIMCFPSIAAAENYIGIILDGYQNDCTVQSRGEEYECKENRQLFAGDKIVKKPDIKGLKIKWAPYSQGKQLDKMSLIVVFDPPQNKKGVVKGVKEILGLVKTGHGMSVAATRSASLLQPGDGATLLSGNKSTFAWKSDGGKQIIFKNSKGIEIFKKELRGEPSIELSPDEIGMKLGEVYTWHISGTRYYRQSKIRLLAQDIAQQVTADLGLIEKETTEDVERTINKAAYLQFMSDAYPQDIDLYWLSYLYLQEISNEKVAKEDDMLLLNDLKMRYLSHVMETM